MIMQICPGKWTDVLTVGTTTMIFQIGIEDLVLIDSQLFCEPHQRICPQFHFYKFNREKLEARPIPIGVIF